MPYNLRQEEKFVRLLSPAKINLFLAITGKRADGYHELLSLFCPITLYDTVTLTFGGEHIRVSCEHPDVPDNEANIAYRAAALFFERLGRNDGVMIRIDKQIPVAAGLGGGSSNAASVLISMNEYYNYPFSQNELGKMGLKLGADVPFFIFGKPALASGIGEKLETVERIKPYKILVIFPGFGVSTAHIYKNLNLRLTNCKKKLKNSCFKDSDIDAACCACNDLESVTEVLYPEISEIKQRLMTYGAKAALMSGSGSSVFGLFSDISRSEQAFRVLSAHPRWKCYLTDMKI
jgi:4-diphosphocytidyl-2-C-methyl-D-erythritol kinase